MSYVPFPLWFQRTLTIALAIFLGLVVTPWLFLYIFTLFLED
jgi:hypothetical protein